MSNQDPYRRQAQARGLRTADDVDRIARRMHPIYRRLLTPWLPESPSASIYEVACGPGIMLRFLRQQGFTNIGGSDSSDYQIALARTSGVTVELADSLRELETRSGETLDCLIGIDFLEHLPREGVAPFLAGCHRTLKPGGCLILRVPNGDSPLVGRHLFNDITHHWAFTSVALRTLLHQAGFEAPVFADEAMAAIEQQRWIKVPLMKAAQLLLRGLIRAATREPVECLSPSFFVFARKPARSP